ncbi:MAG: hypothetical protein ABSE56_24275 [Bryobacteraceae bacterium]
MISLEHAKQALLRSGYLLENRVESLLVRRGYGVQANTPFLDTISEKERELDLHALRLVSAGPAEFDFVWSVLLIECVNNPQPIAFVTKDSDLRETEIYRIKMAGVPTRIIDPQKPGRWILLADYLGMSRYHHYCKGRTATQFCSFSQKKGSNDWMASHIDEHWDDLGKVIRALEHFRSDLFDCWRPPSRKRQPDHINVEIYYPLVVLQGELLDVQQSRTALHIRPAKHMQYTRSTLSAGRESFYQIDVVTERYLPRYLTIIEEELERTGRLLRRRQKHVRKSLNRLVTAASRYRSPDRIRSALEPAAHFLE